MRPFEAPGFDLEMPLQLRLFEAQTCGKLQIECLASAVEHYIITPAEPDAMIAGKLLLPRSDKAGTEGFLLCTEQQAGLAARDNESLLIEW